MGPWDIWTIDHAAMDNGTMDNATMGQRGHGTIDNGTMDAGTMDSRTIGPCDSENGAVVHWRIQYTCIGAMWREGHGRRDNAQYVNARDHLPSMHE
jgi:hypothetical protein